MNSFHRLVSLGTPDHRLICCRQVFGANVTCGRGVSGGVKLDGFSDIDAVFSRPVGLLSTSKRDNDESEGVKEAEFVSSSRAYLVSGQKNNTTSQLTPVKIAAIHLCQRHPRLSTTNPQINGPMVLPPAMAFM